MDPETWQYRLRLASLGAWAVWQLIFWLLGPRSLKLGDTGVRRQSPRLTWLALLVSLLSALILLATAVSILAGWLAPLSALDTLAVTALGFAALAAGVWGYLSAARVLGRLWTPYTALLPGHQLVETGLFRLVRHPIYTSLLLLFTGTALAFPTLWSLAAAGLMDLVYVLKALEEDRFLKRYLPGYAEYAGRVPRRLIPGVW